MGQIKQGTSKSRVGKKRFEHWLKNLFKTHEIAFPVFSLTSWFSDASRKIFQIIYICCDNKFGITSMKLISLRIEIIFILSTEKGTILSDKKTKKTTEKRFCFNPCTSKWLGFNKTETASRTKQIWRRPWVCILWMEVKKRSRGHQTLVSLISGAPNEGSLGRARGRHLRDPGSTLWTLCLAMAACLVSSCRSASSRSRFSCHCVNKLKNGFIRKRVSTQNRVTKNAHFQALQLSLSTNRCARTWTR